MFNTTTNNTIIVRNYIILAATVMFASMGSSDTFLYLWGFNTVKPRQIYQRFLA